MTTAPAKPAAAPIHFTLRCTTCGRVGTTNVRWPPDWTPPLGVDFRCPCGARAVPVDAAPQKTGRAVATP